MGSVDRDDDARTFKVNFSTDGVAKLMECVKEKLKEFMGDYTDDILVEYVIVLLRNGKRKDQARNELNVFLGDDSDSFVSWLWDHLDLNLGLYVKPEELQVEDPKVISEVQAGGDVFQHSNSQSERGKSNKLPRSRRNRDWKGLVSREAEPHSIQSSEVDNPHLKGNAPPKLNRDPRSLSPKPLVQRKRGRADEQQRTKRDVVSHAAPRRLLQFAVRDAVATSRTTNPSTSVEPSLKRLRSVVSTSSGDSSLTEHPQRLQPASRVSNPMASVLKAVAEAAEDVMKSKSSGSVFNRLGSGRNSSVDKSQLEDNFQHQEQNQSLYLQRSGYNGQRPANTTIMEHETGAHSDSASDNEGFHDVDVMGHRVTEISQFSSSGGNADDSLRLKRNREQEKPVAARASHKIVNISVNVNTWKPPQYQEPSQVAQLAGHKASDHETGAHRSGMQLMEDNTNTSKVSNGNANPSPDVQKESSKSQLCISGSSLAGRPLEDVESRTIFVSNVHFAATKDGLSRHFNKFGEVLKVIIVTDAATGQPKGAAYVEFMRKEAADNALSLDGTSFMSRILKVVMKSAAHQESTPTMGWPRILRGSPFSTARFSRVPFPRGIPGAFRPRPPLKVGARSMQWKRDAQGSPSDNGSALTTGNIGMPSPSARGLTYVRTESKPEGSSGTT